jgi:DNA-binding CsgD family transcriptional regulator
MPRNRLTKLDKALRDADIWTMRAAGHSVQEIAESQELSISTVRNSLTRVAEQYKVESAAEIIKMELDRLDIMLVHAMDALEGEYVAWSNGRMMRDDDDQPVPDVGPTMKAIDTILKIMDRRSKYLGLDAPSKSEQHINVHQDPNAVDLQVLDLINTFKASAAALSPADLQHALPSHPHQDPETITLPADHFTTHDTTPDTAPEREHA